MDAGAMAETSPEAEQNDIVKPDENNNLSADASYTAAMMNKEGPNLQRQAEGLVGNDTISGEHPGSIGTPTMEEVQTIANRNGIDANEEPQVGEDGQEIPASSPSPEELTRRVEALNTDRGNTQSRINESPAGSPERQRAEQEMSVIQMLLNIMEYGSINPPTGSVDAQGNLIEGQNSYSGGVGQPLSAEMLAEYGGTGHELASWLQQRGYPIFEGQPNYCGRNVGEAMNAFGYQGLPNSGRNGADWANICRSRPNQFKQIQCTPQEAPAGALISYARNSGGSEARQASGHIEIALGENRGYYYGAVASAPGGSQKPPMPGSYTIWMPVSKTV